MDELYFQKRRRANAVSGLPLFDERPAEREARENPVPSRHDSETSIEAAQRIAPMFGNNKAVCYRAIVKAASRGGISRKEIAELHFNSQQQYVTGPTRVLLDEGLVYEKPLRNSAGTVITRPDNSIQHEKRDGSVLILPVRGG